MNNWLCMIGVCSFQSRSFTAQCKLHRTRSDAMRHIIALRGLCYGAHAIRSAMETSKISTLGSELVFRPARISCAGTSTNEDIGTEYDHLMKSRSTLGECISCIVYRSTAFRHAICQNDPEVDFRARRRTVSTVDST